MLDQLLDYLNIKELYPPQKEAMQAIERNESLLMSVPTAAGKTVVAYNALMKAVNEGKKGIFLVPLRALAAAFELSWSPPGCRWGSGPPFFLIVLAFPYVFLLKPLKKVSPLRSLPDFLS